MNKKLLQLSTFIAIVFSSNTFAKQDSSTFGHEYSPSVYDLSAFESELRTDLEESLGETMEKLLIENMNSIKKSIQHEYNQNLELITDSKKKSNHFA